MKRLLSCLALAAAACAAGAPETGKPAPPLTLDQVLQAPAGTTFTWDRLKGTAIVLEFWATWCGGCREQISHLNHLAENFKDRPVRFISITDEEVELVRRFLKDYPIAGWIGIDLHGKTFGAYNVEGRPRTMLVDAAGILRGVGSAAELTSTVMEDFLAGKPVDLENSSQPQKLQTMPNPFFETMIRPAAPESVTRYSPGAEARYGDGIAGWGLTLKRMAARAYGVPEQRIEAPGWCATDLFDMAVTYPGLSPEGQAQQLRSALELTFQLKARKQSRGKDVYEVRLLSGVKPKLVPSTASSAGSWGEAGNLKFNAASLRSISAAVEKVLKLPTFDETGITGRFDMELQWDAANPQSLIQSIRGQLGLDLVKTRRPLEYLVIDSAVRPSSW